jgi:predicted nucleic acid-binding protein
MPGKHRISSDQAMLFIGDIPERLSVVSLSGEEYAEALGIGAARGVVGGGIYDVLLAQCALKAEAATICTWNIRHYALCGASVTNRLRQP